MALTFDDIWNKVSPFITAENVGALVGGALGSLDSDTTETQAPYLYPGQLEGIANVIDLASQEYDLGPQQYFPGQTVAALDPNVIGGQNMALGQMDILRQLADTGTFAAAELASGGAGRIEGFDLPDQVGYGIDPGLEAAVMSPIMRELQNRVLPGIEMQATQQGAFGGTRQQMMMGQAAAEATGRASEAVARANLEARNQNIQQRSTDIDSMLSGRQQDIQQNQLYNSAMQSGMGGIAGMMGAQMIPAETMLDIGRQRTAYEQELLNADIDRFNFNQQAPINALSLLGQRMSMQFPGGSINTVNRPANISTILGGALTGSQLAGSIFRNNNTGSGSSGAMGSLTPEQIRQLTGSVL